MTAKRFIMLPFEEGNLIFDELKYDFDNEWYDSRLCLKDKEIVNLLNELHEGNQQLREALKELKEIGDYQADRIQELSDENRQLEQQMQAILKLTKKIEDCTHDIKLIGDVE